MLSLSLLRTPVGWIQKEDFQRRPIHVIIQLSVAISQLSQQVNRGGRALLAVATALLPSGQYLYDVVEAAQVAVLVVAQSPWRPVRQLFTLVQRQHLREVDHPDVRHVAAVVEEEQRTANHL